MCVIQFLYSLIGTPLGYILYFIYRFICSNVGIAILIFTLIVKLATLPLTIKQQKDSAKSAVFQPKVMEIQQKYANNREKQQEELLKLQQQGYKPMSGCGPMLLSFLILFGVIDVVYKPLTHIEHMNKETISVMAQEAYGVEVASIFAEEVSKTPDEVVGLNKKAALRHDDIVIDAQNIINYYNEHCLEEGKEAIDINAFKKLDEDTVEIVETVFKSAVSDAYTADTSNKKKKQKQISDTDLYLITKEETAQLDAMTDEKEKEKFRAEHSFSKSTAEALTNAQVHYGAYAASSEDGAVFASAGNMQSELYTLECFGTVSDKFTYKDAFGEDAVRPETRAELEELHSNLNFVGIPLGQVPKDHFGFPLLLIPIISFIMSMLQTIISNKMMTASNPETAQAMGPMKITLFLMPLLSLWIAYTVPAGAGFYWGISYAVGIIQTLVLNKLFNPLKLKEAAAAEINAKGKVIEAKAKSSKISAEESQKQKEINRRKLAQARREDAEKYGEEYHDDDDDE